jgi:hypothetical protein
MKLDDITTALFVSLKDKIKTMKTNHLNLEQILTGMKDKPRRKLFDLAKELIGNAFEMVRTDPDNEFSPFIVLMDGISLKYSSTGTRLVLVLLGTMLNESIETLIIDEPEIGLSPRLQARFAQFLFDKEKRLEFCPHIKHVFIATHSHILLDRKVYSNNFVVRKDGNLVSCKAIDSVSDFHQLQFNMLGNDLEMLYLPAAIVIVEGDTDAMYCSKLVGYRIPNRKIAFIKGPGRRRGVK